MTYFDELSKATAEKTLKQEELFPLFAKAHHLLKECMMVLIQENNIIQFAVTDLGAEIASGIDRNKAIFTRNVEYNNKDKFVDYNVDKTKQQNEFLCTCMDIQNAVFKKDIKTQQKIIEKIPISRIIFESVIITWLNTVRNYNNIALDYLKASVNKDINKQVELAEQLYLYEKKYNLDYISGFGTINFVSNRINAIKFIYNRISKAYARAVLKMAKSQSVSSDYVLDSYQNGNLGLLRAISSYDHISNARFPGFAKWWIRQKMLFCMKEEANIIKVSSNTWQHYAKLEAIKNRLESEKGHVTFEMLAEAADKDAAQVESIYTSIKTSQVKSLEYQLSSDGFTLMTVASGGAEDPLIVEDSLTAIEEVIALEEQTSKEEQDENNIRELLNKLPKKLKRLVCLQFGLIEYIDQLLDQDKIDKERNRQELALQKKQNLVKTNNYT